MKYLFVLVIFISSIVLANENTGTICLGENLSKPFQDQTNRLYLKINNSKKIFFSRPYAGPIVVVNQLNLKTDHLVKVYFDDQVVQSWVINFEKLNATGVNIWRGPGAWRSDVIEPSDCK